MLDDDVGGGRPVPLGRGVGRIGEVAVGRQPDAEHVVGVEHDLDLPREGGDVDGAAPHGEPGDGPGARPPGGERRARSAPGRRRQPERRRDQQRDEPAVSLLPPQRTHWRPRLESLSLGLKR